MYHDLVQHNLSPEHPFWVGQVPAALRLDQTEFEALWQLHPEQYHEILIVLAATTGHPSETGVKGEYRPRRFGTSRLFVSTPQGIVHRLRGFFQIEYTGVWCEREREVQYLL